MNDNSTIYAGPTPEIPAPTQPPRPDLTAEPKKNNRDLIKTIVIIVVSLIAATFIGLFIWIFIKNQDASTNLESQIDIAVADAVDEQTKKLEIEFAEREKNPYKIFSGPEDYGLLSFEYPKTWSLYVAKDASDGKNYEAYFNPDQVEPISDDTINALRVIIRNDTYDKVLAEYQKAMEKKDSNLTVSSVTFNGIDGTKYSGTIPDTELNGYIVIFKIRDKTVILQTDSILFESEFNTLLETVTFNS